MSVEWREIVVSRADRFHTLSGLIANALAAIFGYVTPFDASFVLLLILFYFVFTTWTENYGNASASVSSGEADAHCVVCT